MRWSGASKRPGGVARVLLLTDLAELGGAERRLIDLATYVDRERFEPVFCVLSGDGPLLEELRRRGFPCVSFGVRSGKDYPRAFWQLLRLIREFRPAIVHGQIRYAAFLAAMAGRLMRVPVVIASRTYTARLGSHVYLDRWTTQMVDVTIAVSEAAADVVRRDEHVRPERLRVIVNGINLDEFSAPPRRQVEETARKLGLEGWRVVGTVGHLHPIKGHRDFIESARAVLDAAPRTKFLIVGDGPLDHELAQLAAARGVAEHVVLTGFRRDVPALLAVMDVFVLPSLNEGMSHALLEAMALGKPVIATAVGGNREVVEHKVTGLLVPPSNPPALAAAVTRVLGDPALGSQLGVAAASAATERFSARHMAAQYFDAYESLLERGTGSA